MSNDLKIQLGSAKNINSVDVDNYTNIELTNSQNKLLEYDIRNVLSVTEVFEAERQLTEVYRIYGGFEYLSILNGITKSYNSVDDFFIHVPCTDDNSCSYKNVIDDFTFYLVKPSTEFTKLGGDSISYIRNFEVIATPNDFDLFRAGFSKNVYGDGKYSFAFKSDFDVTGVVDYFGMPITELFLYCVYTNGEEMKRLEWSDHDSSSYKDFSPGTLSVGDIVYGDKVIYSEIDYYQDVDTDAAFKIITPYKDGSSNKELWWKYNPFIPFQLRYLSDDVSRANTGSTSYEQATSVPYYATDLDNGNFVWREILEQGNIDPLTGKGVDYPFINKRRYLFSNLILSVVPDLTHTNTKTVFTEIKFDDPELLNTKINNDLNDVGKPCS